MKAIKLFCIPYAGGSATMFFSWNKHFNNAFELVPLELSGRGLRFDEPGYVNFSDMLIDIYNSFCDRYDGSPYAFYGHSMGSLLVYELCRLIKSKNGQMPMYIFLSGRCPPHIEFEARIRSDMEDDVLIENLKQMGGVPDELFMYKAVFLKFLKILRNDLRVMEGYRWEKEENDKLDCPIAVFNGSHDIAESDMFEWSKCTKSEFEYFSFEGGHFFINDNINEIARIINLLLVPCGND